jgi:hypothetical protein
MLRWQVADWFSFQRRLSAARRTGRRPVPELADITGSDPQDK